MIYADGPTRYCEFWGLNVPGGRIRRVWRRLRFCWHVLRGGDYVSIAVLENGRMEHVRIRPGDETSASRGGGADWRTPSRASSHLLDAYDKLILEGAGGHAPAGMATDAPVMTPPSDPAPSLPLHGVDLIAAERRRQIEAEGWTPEHDAEHDDGALVQAAACYLLAPGIPIPPQYKCAACAGEGVTYRVSLTKQQRRDERACVRCGGSGKLSDCPPLEWPWEREWWKPGPTRIRNLEKAGALIAAEIDRLQALAKSGEAPQ